GLGMFLRSTKRTLADGTKAEYFQLAQSVWDPIKKQPVTDIIHNFGRADEATRERLRLLARSILTRVGTVDEMAGDSDLRLVDSFVYGGFHVVRALWKRCGLQEAIERAVVKAETDMPLAEALFAMVANRLLAPRSKLYCYEQWLAEEVYFPEGEDLQLHHLYRAMDLLEREHEVVEKEVFWKVATLMNLDVDLIFYDTTSLHFEIDFNDEVEQQGNELAGKRSYPAQRKRGKSKNGRSDAPQIVIGLAVTRDGLPVRCWIFPGNTVDVTTVKKVKADLRGWQLGRCVFVGDAGMVSAANLVELSRGGGRYLLAKPVARGDEITTKVVGRPGRYRSVADNLLVKEVWWPSKAAGERRQRYAVCFNPGEAKRQSRHREELLAQLEAELATLRVPDEGHSKRICNLLSTPRYKRYLRQTRGGGLAISRKAVRVAERLDGKWVVTTNDDTLSVEDMALGYKQLLRVEECWRSMKSGLRMRPVHHYTPHRIHAHIRLCVLALLIERMAEKLCGDTWRNIRDDLNQVKVGILQGSAGRIVQVTEAREDARKRLEQLDIQPPPLVLSAT
ncbi:MAG: IS1634 family transposase, partial [Planctomycetota bacterium]